MNYQVYFPYSMEIFSLLNLFSNHHVSWWWLLLFVIFDGMTDFSGHRKIITNKAGKTKYVMESSAKVN